MIQRRTVAISKYMPEYAEKEVLMEVDGEVKRMPAARPITFRHVLTHTAGVDPASRRTFWTTIGNLAERGTTVLVTTHYMDEAERCDRIAIIDRGRIVAIDTPSALKASIGADVVTVETADDGVARSQIAASLGIEGEVTEHGLRLHVPDGEAFVPELFTRVDVGIRNVNVRRPSLDAVFMEYTGRAIRDAEVGTLARFKLNAMTRGFRKS